MIVDVDILEVGTAPFQGHGGRSDIYFIEFADEVKGEDSRDATHAGKLTNFQKELLQGFYHHVAVPNLHSVVLKSNMPGRGHTITSNIFPLAPVFPRQPVIG